MYRFDNVEVDVKKDYLFFIQFNVLLSYIAKGFDMSPDEYFSFVESDDCDIRHVSHICEAFNLNVHDRWYGASEKICTTTKCFGLPFPKYELPIQVIHLPPSLSLKEATHCMAYLEGFGNYGAGVAETDDRFAIFRTQKADWYFYEGVYLLVFITPKEITDYLKKQNAELLTWDHKLIESNNRLDSDIPLVLDAFYTSIKQSVSQQLSPLKAKFELFNWWRRQSKQMFKGDT